MPDEISLRIGSQTVTGSFTYRSTNVVQVEITSGVYPFRLTLEMYVPESRSTGRLLGEEGIGGARRILRHLHRVCRFLTKNRLQLIERYRTYASGVKQAKGVTGISDFLFDKLTQRLHGELEKGAITEDEYKLKLSAAQYDNYNYHRLLWSLRKTFFGYFPFTLQPELQDQVLQWLGWEAEGEYFIRIESMM